MSPLASILAVLAASSVANAGLTGLLQVPEVNANFTSCLEQPMFFSCENRTTIKDTCCSPTPGGLGTSL